MRCTKMATCPHSCDAKIADNLSSWLVEGIAVALENNKVPRALAEKVSVIINSELDACVACDLVTQGVEQLEEEVETRRPRVRIFDRAVVHMLELFYASVVERSRSPDRLIKAAPEFFNIVPRGECLDLFLKMIKRQCIGDDEVIVYTKRLEMIIEPYAVDGEVNWDRVYIDGKFAAYVFDLFTIIFSHMKPGGYPVPALNNGMAARLNPERINLLLKHMLAVWEMQQSDAAEDLVVSG